MDTSFEKWISELAMDDHDFLDQCQANTTGFHSVDECTQLVSVTGEILQQSSSSESNTACPTLNLNCNTSATTAGAGLSGSAVEICQTGFERPTKQIKTNTQTTSITGQFSPTTPSSFHISFTDLGSFPSSPSANPQQSCENLDNTLEQKDEVVSKGDMSINPSSNSKGPYDIENNQPKAGQKRSPLELQDRVIAERKRREKLSERFIALSAIIPGLKKMDKASVLGDAIKHLKQLHERVKLLEEQIKKSEESVVLVKKSQLFVDDDSSSCDENFDGHLKEGTVPEIEVRISEKFVLIRIHCKKQKGLAVKLLSEIEMLQLSIIDSNFFPFGQYAMDITVVAQMDANFCMTVKDLVRKVRSAFLKFVSPA